MIYLKVIYNILWLGLLPSSQRWFYLKPSAWGWPMFWGKKSMKLSWPCKMLLPEKIWKHILRYEACHLFFFCSTNLRHCSHTGSIFFQSIGALWFISIIGSCFSFLTLSYTSKPLSNFLSGFHCILIYTIVLWKCVMYVTLTNLNNHPKTVT